MNDQQPGGDLHVTARPAPDGTYGIEVACGPRAWPLTEGGAVRYALAVLAVVNAADHDAAVARLLTRDLGLPLPTVAETLSKVRVGRAPFDHEATAPLRFEPGVNGSLDPFIGLYLDGQRVGQLTVNLARGHAVALLNVAATVPLDEALHRRIVGDFALSPDLAARVVNDLAGHRTRDDEE